MDYLCIYAAFRHGLGMVLRNTPMMTENGSGIIAKLTPREIPFTPLIPHLPKQTVTMMAISSNLVHLHFKRNKRLSLSKIATIIIAISFHNSPARVATKKAQSQL